MPAVVAPLPDLVLYTRAGCHLCDEARDAIDLLLTDRRARGLALPGVVEVDIGANPVLERAYFDRIPVVELGGATIEQVVTISQLRGLLAALDTTAA
jgi:hypothetical protein